MLILKTEADLQISINEVCQNAQQNLLMIEESFKTGMKDQISSQTAQQFKEDLKTLRSIVQSIKKVADRKTNRTYHLFKDLHQFQKQYHATSINLLKILDHALKGHHEFYRLLQREAERVFLDEFDTSSANRLLNLQDLLETESLDDFAPFVRFDLTNLALMERYPDSIRSICKEWSRWMTKGLREKLDDHEQFEFDEYFESKKKKCEEHVKRSMSREIAYLASSDISDDLKKSFIDNDSLTDLQQRLSTVVSRSLDNERCQEIGLSHIRETFNEIYKSLKLEYDLRNSRTLTEETIASLLQDSLCLREFQVESEAHVDESEIRFAIRLRGGHFFGYDIHEIASNRTEVAILRQEQRVQVQESEIEVVEATYQDRIVKDAELNDLNLEINRYFEASIEAVIGEIIKLIKSC